MEEGTLHLHGMYFHVAEAQAYLLDRPSGVFTAVRPDARPAAAHPQDAARPGATGPVDARPTATGPEDAAPTETSTETSTAPAAPPGTVPPGNPLPKDAPAATLSTKV